jgi:positive regulator of sigma E activity
MTKENCSLTKVKDLVEKLKSTVNFLTSGAIESGTALEMEIEESLVKQVIKIEEELWS